MKILIAGDIVGSPGRSVFKNVASKMRSDGQVDFIIANAENSAGGRGLTAKLAEELFDGGADVLTLGDHVWDQRSLVSHIDNEPRIIRPANYPPGTPGKGWVRVDTESGAITVINLLGRVFMNPNDCPFRTVDKLLQSSIPADGAIIVDLHAEATSEKIAMGHFLNGRVSAVVGSHTHVQTSDNKILSKGTGYITDLGMTGPLDSVLGRDKDTIIKRFITGMPTKFDIAKEDIALEGVLLDIDMTTGKTINIVRIRESLSETYNKG